MKKKKSTFLILENKMLNYKQNENRQGIDSFNI